MLNATPEALEPIDVPPDEAVYQFIDPALEVPTIVAVPVPQLLPAVYPVIIGLEQPAETTSSYSSFSPIKYPPQAATPQSLLFITLILTEVAVAVAGTFIVNVCVPVELVVFIVHPLTVSLASKKSPSSFQSTHIPIAEA